MGTIPSGDSAVPVSRVLSTLKLYLTFNSLPSGVLIKPVHLPSRSAATAIIKIKQQPKAIALKNFLFIIVIFNAIIRRLFLKKFLNEKKISPN
jgi:hypothetical protein